MGKYMDVLEAISSESDASDEGEQGEGQPSTSEAAAAATAKRQKKEITVADLARAGYRSGPSVLTIRAPQEESAQLNYYWSDGRDARSSQVAETVEDRLATQHAALVGAETTARHAVATAQEAERIRELRRKEREEEVAERKKESFNQKEKRKRDEGKQARGKSYVEEEKRLQRQFGVYSGFDN